MNVKDNLFLLRFKVFEYKREILLLVASFVFTVFSSEWLSSLRKDSWPETFKNDNLWPLKFDVTRIVLWVLLFLFLTVIWDSLYKIIKRGKYYKFKSQDWPQKWLFHGGIIAGTNPSCLFIRRSRSGCLLKKYLWKNFKMNFEMNFLKNLTKGTPNEYNLDRSLGVIFRALNLENYFMLEITEKKIENSPSDLLVKPHIRFNGNWEVVDEILIKGIDLDKDLLVKLQVQNLVVSLFINKKIVYEWNLPSHTDVDVIRLQVSGGDTDKDEKSKTNIPEIPFLDEYGMVGFRAYPGQGAIVNSLEIKTL